MQSPEGATRSVKIGRFVSLSRVIYWVSKSSFFTLSTVGEPPDMMSASEGEGVIEKQT